MMPTDRVSCNYEQCQTTRERHHSGLGSLTVLRSMERSIHTIPCVVPLVAWASSSGLMPWCSLDMSAMVVVVVAACRGSLAAETAALNDVDWATAAVVFADLDDGGMNDCTLCMKLNVNVKEKRVEKLGLIKD